MSKAFIVLWMIFFHIVDDYYLQGWLASAKQKEMVEGQCSAASIQIRLHLGAPNAQFQLGIYDYASYRCYHVVQHFLVLPGILLTQCFRPCFSRRFESKP